VEQKGYVWNLSFAYRDKIFGFYWECVVPSTKTTNRRVPNPAKDRVRVEIEGLADESTLTIIDGLGRVVLNQIVGKHAELNTNHLRSGIYQVRARDNASFVQKTLIIE